MKINHFQLKEKTKKQKIYDSITINIQNQVNLIKHSVYQVIISNLKMAPTSNTKVFKLTHKRQYNGTTQYLTEWTDSWEKAEKLYSHRVLIKHILDNRKSNTGEEQYKIRWYPEWTPFTKLTRTEITNYYVSKACNNASKTFQADSNDVFPTFDALFTSNRNLATPTVHQQQPGPSRSSGSTILPTTGTTQQCPQPQKNPSNFKPQVKTAFHANDQSKIYYTILIHENTKPIMMPSELAVEKYPELLNQFWEKKFGHLL